MTLAVVSDSHGNLKGLRQVTREILSKHSVDLFIHLGDDYEDAGVFDELECEYLRVPGVFSDYYADRSVPNRLLREIEGWRFLLSHTDGSHSNDLPEDLKPEQLIAEKQVDVVLHGHSHQPKLAIRDGILFANPGHVKTEDKKGHAPSYAIIDVNSEEVSARIIKAGTGDILDEIGLKRTQAGERRKP